MLKQNYKWNEKASTICKRQCIKHLSLLSAHNQVVQQEATQTQVYSILPEVTARTFIISYTQKQTHNLTSSVLVLQC